MPSLAGQVVGAYRLLSPIGQGGIGQRLARRTLRRALRGTRRGQAAERRADRPRRRGAVHGAKAPFSRGCSHPRIAHLIDAGVSPAGQPYLVLEHVDGQSIDRYCDDRALGIEARLRLFLDVLDAVAHAHANLIVHRDIKPANVLVSSDGQVKLLDFGIAKLIERDADVRATATPEPSALTREGGAALTPEYAAPEQLSGGAVTTATDVYALGVLLYVLLSGRHPAGRRARIARDAGARDRRTEPPRISDAVVVRTSRRARSSRPRDALRHDVEQAAPRRFAAISTPSSPRR